jgi:hypothetical protein
MVVGHEGQRHALEALLVHGMRAVLLAGPESVGKYTIACEAAALVAPAACDVLKLQQLDADAAATITRFAQTAPLSGFVKVIAARLDGASDVALNALLKVIEESEAVVFILTASKPVLPTVISRCVRIQFGSLSDEQVAEVLQLTGMDPLAARKWAPAGAGSVRRALDAQAYSPVKSRVIAALRAVAGHNREQLYQALSLWDGDCQWLLLTWGQESVTGRWRTFAESDVPLSSVHGRKLLTAIARNPQARAKLSAISALGTLMED